MWTIVWKVKTYTYLKMIFWKAYMRWHSKRSAWGNFSASLLGIQDQRLDAEQDQLPCGPQFWQLPRDGILHGSTPRQPLQNHPLGHLETRATPWSAEEILDRQHQWVDIPAHARTDHNGLLQKRLEEDFCWIVCHVSRRPNRSRDWTELNWTDVLWLYFVLNFGEQWKFFHSVSVVTG